MAVSFCAEDEIDFLRDIEKTIKNAIPRFTDHPWHSESLNEKHIRGFRPPAVKQGGRGGQNSGGGGGGGGNRRGSSSGNRRGRNGARPV
jgi:ATP-dependent RNA helicase RhlE